MKKQLLVALSLLTVTSLLGQQARLANPLPKSTTTKNGVPNVRTKHSLGQKRTNHNNSTSSVVSFSEDFDGIPGSTAGGVGTYSFPSGWFLSNVDNNTPASSVSYVNEAWERREDFANNVVDSCAFSTSWYTPAGTANDFMWTPAIANLPANSVLSWNAVAYDPAYSDGYEVRIMTVAPTGGTGIIGNQITSSTVLYSTAAENSSWTARTVSLNAYAGQTVYIGFRNNTNDKFLLAIDDIVVQTQVNYDAALVSIDTLTEYTEIPVKQAIPLTLGGDIMNNGISALTNVQLKVDILDASNNIVYTNTSVALASLAAGATASFTVAPATFAYATGTYKAKYYPVMTETDQESSNDTLSSFVTYTNFTYARDTGAVVGSLGIGAGNGGYLGNSYQINTTADLTSITAYYTQGYTGTKYATVVYSTLPNGTPDAIIASTDTLLYPDDSARVYTSKIHGGPITLAPGTYVVTAIEFDSTLALGQTASIFTPGKMWVNWPTNPLGGWANAEAFGTSFSKPFVIRPNFELPVAASFTAPASSCPGSIAFTDTSMYAASYSWSFPGGNPATSNSQSPVVSYTAGSVYTASLVVTNNNGNSTPVTQTFTVNNLPTVTAAATNTAVCTGNQTTLNGGGALSYTWTNGITDGTAFTPTISATYSVTGTDANGCSDTASIMVTINNLPAVTGTATPSNTICAGDGVTLNGSGAITYTWTNGVTDGVAFTPTITATYTVTGTDANNCSNTDTVHVVVNICTGIAIVSNNIISVYPNPNNGQFTVSIANSINTFIEIYNSIGQLVIIKQVNTTIENVQLNEVNNGLYLLRIKQNGAYIYQQNIIINK